MFIPFLAGAVAGVGRGGVTGPRRVPSCPRRVPSCPWEESSPFESCCGHSRPGRRRSEVQPFGALEWTGRLLWLSLTVEPPVPGEVPGELVGHPLRSLLSTVCLLTAWKQTTGCG